MSSFPSRQMLECIDVFRCPRCGGPLTLDTGVRCTHCAHTFQVEDGIPCLYAPAESAGRQEALTQQVRAFYEETPFPNYDEFESLEDLIRKAEKGLFARLLNDQIPFNSRVLEVGCGTGQLTNYLGVAERNVFGVDMTLNSLKLANAFKNRHRLDHVGFYQMNLYRPAFREESFDIVLCNGVLCAAADPYGGFRSIAPLVKRGGYLLVGSYNRYGRLITDLRRAVINTLGERFAFLDPHLRRNSLRGRKKEAWFADQYRHPYETKHTIGQLLGWFADADFEFVYGIPNPKAFQRFSTNDAIFEPHPAGNRLDHLIVQAQLVLHGSYEGGFFTMIGRRR